MTRDRSRAAPPHPARQPSGRRAVGRAHADGAPADWLPFLMALADRADAIALRLFRKKRLRVAAKPDRSPVTEADEAIEAVVRAVTRERHAELGLLGEEEGATAGTSSSRLIVDPIDATRNFVRGIPVFATLLAIEVGDDVVAGVVSAPALGVRWHAARGAGAFRGRARLAVSRVPRLDQALLFHGNLAPGETAPPPGLLALVPQVDRTRGFGDFYQHMLVAEGAGEIGVDPAMQPWDIAPLLVIVEEAGGRATSLSGHRSIYGGSLVTSNGLFHQAIVQRLTTTTT